MSVLQAQPASEVTPFTGMLGIMGKILTVSITSYKNRVKSGAGRLLPAPEADGKRHQYDQEADKYSYVQ